MKLRIDNKYSISEMTFGLFLFFITIYYSYRKANIDYSVFNIFMYMALPFWGLKLLCDGKITLKRFVLVVLFVAAAGMAVLKIHNTAILVSFMAMAAMKNIDYQKALKIIFWTRVVTCMLLLLGVALSIVPNSVYVRQASGVEEGTTRMSLGYAHPNTFGIYCFVILSLWFIIYGKHNLHLKIIFALLLDVVQFVFTNSRTSFLLIMIFVFMIIVSKNRKIEKLIKKYSPFAMAIGFCMNYGMIFTIGTPLGKILNKLLSSRVTLSESFIRVYGIKPFGQEIFNSVSGSIYWHLDSGYLNMFIQNGAIIGVIYLLLCYYMAKKMKHESVYLHVSIIAFSFYGIIEDVLSSMLFSYLWILIGYAFYKKRNNLSFISEMSEKLHLSEILS